MIAAQQRWSVAATKAKQRIRRGRRAALGLGVAGTVLVTAAAQADGSVGRVLAGLAAAALASVPIVAGFFAGPERTRTWTQLRSVSERIRAEISVYLAGVSPYDGSPAERARQLLDNGEKIQQDAGIDPPAALVSGPPSQRLPEAGSLDAYVTYRVDDQIGYYESQAAAAERHIIQFQWAGLATSLAAAVLGALEAATGGAALTAWAPVITMVGASVGSYAAASRYEDDARAYKQTARRLRFLRDRWRLPLPAGTSAAERARLDTVFVTGCEEAIAIENQTWTARWNADGSVTPASPAEQPA